MMEFIKQPMAIERRSMELIAPYIEGISLSEAEKKVYSRIIHAAGDVEYAPIIRISETAVADATAALRSGADIYTDVEMVRTGINKRKLASFGGAVHCRIQDPEIAAQAKAQESAPAEGAEEQPAGEDDVVDAEIVDEEGDK